MPEAKPEAPGSAWPPLPLADWRDTLATLHLWTQVVGKTRLALAPMEDHWWQCTLQVSDRGLTTTLMPQGTRFLTVDFDFIDHSLRLRTTDVQGVSRPLCRQAEPVPLLLGQFRPGGNPLLRIPRPTASGRRTELPGLRDGRGLFARMQQRRLLARRWTERWPV